LQVKTSELLKNCILNEIEIKICCLRNECTKDDDHLSIFQTFNDTDKNSLEIMNNHPFTRYFKIVSL
jgi:hypothetical protein